MTENTIPNPMPWFPDMQGPEVSTETLPDGRVVDTYTWTGPPTHGTFTLSYGDPKRPLPVSDGSVAGAVRAAVARNRRR